MDLGQMLQGIGLPGIHRNVAGCAFGGFSSYVLPPLRCLAGGSSPLLATVSATTRLSPPASRSTRAKASSVRSSRQYHHFLPVRPRKLSKLGCRTCGPKRQKRTPRSSKSGTLLGPGRWTRRARQIARFMRANRRLFCQRLREAVLPGYTHAPLCRSAVQRTGRYDPIAASASPSAGSPVPPAVSGKPRPPAVTQLMLRISSNRIGPHHGALIQKAKLRAFFKRVRSILGRPGQSKRLPLILAKTRAKAARQKSRKGCLALVRNGGRALGTNRAAARASKQCFAKSGTSGKKHAERASLGHPRAIRAHSAAGLLANGW